ncbi:MAG: zinc ribbon domain-containing protein, partial [Conexivisphaera sp.]
KIAKAIRGLGEVNGFEGLDKGGMLTRSHSWNRRIADTDWRGIAARVSMGGGAVEVDPRLTSRTCSRCGWVDRDLRGAVFECEACGLRIDRQLNAAVNIYMRMEGVPHSAVWWDATVLPALVGGYVLTGAERKAPDEPGRGPYDAMKPKLYVAYDRYEDAYLPMRT